MRTIKLDDHLFESLLDLLSNDFNKEYDKQKESDNPDASFMKDDLEIFKACVKDFDFNNDTVNFQYGVIISNWKDKIKEIEEL